MPLPEMILRVPVLETPRLEIRPFDLSDLEAIHGILDLDVGMEAQPLVERREWLEWSVLNYEALARLDQPPYGDRAIVLKASGAVIGACGLAPCLLPFELLPSLAPQSGRPEVPLNSSEIGLYYALASQHQGSGYATEASQALIDYAFSGLRLRRIVATTAHENIASQAVMRRLGMQLESHTHPDYPWFQVVGFLDNPLASAPGTGS